jgi:hypothetical protein
MKHPIAIATLFLTMSTALPALAATPVSTTLRDVAAAPIESVQYRQAPRVRNDRYRSGYDAFASDNGVSNAANRRNGAAAGRSCVSGGEEGAASAFPSWALCR